MCRRRHSGPAAIPAACRRPVESQPWVLYDWQDLFPALQGHEIDAIAASVSITAQRRELVSFSDRYYSNLVRWVAARGSGFDPGALSGQTVGSMRATIAADWLKEHAEGAQVELYATPGDAFDALVRGRIDAFLGDGLGHHAWLQTEADTGFELVGDGYRLDEGIGIVGRRCARGTLAARPVRGLTVADLRPGSCRTPRCRGAGGGAGETPPRAARG